MSDVIGANISYDTLGDVRERLTEVNPLFDRINEIVTADWTNKSSSEFIEDGPIHSAIQNYYMTCPISRASETMAKCSQELITTLGNRTGTNG